MSERQKTIRQEAKKRWETIAKPIDSLGLLEDMVSKLCGIYESVQPPDIKKRAVLTLCADHGVVASKVTQTDSSVTGIVADNIAKGTSSVNYMGAISGVDVYAIDVGMLGDVYDCKELQTGAIIDRKVAQGTKNLVYEAAMSPDVCMQAVEVGRGLVRDLKKKGYTIVALGEMGIGNTTPTTALLAYLLDADVDAVTGRGAGLDDEGLVRKKDAIKAALARVRAMYPSRKITGYRLLGELGGLEIAAMVGVILEASKCQMAVVLDGAITAVAALLANTIEPESMDYVLVSHSSAEPVGQMALEALGLPAIIRGKLCLGEGTGATLLFPMLDAAIAVYEQMQSFEDMEIEAYKREGKP